MATFGEISWETEEKQFDNKSLGKDAWMRLEKGSNVVRILTKPFQYVVHKAVKKESEGADPKKFGQKVKCSDPVGQKDCPLCEMGHKPGVRWFVGVLDKKTVSYKVLDISYQVYSQIKKLSDNKEYWGDPTKYDIDIIVDKNGGPTGYYSVQPLPHKPLTPEQQKAAALVNNEDLAAQSAPLTREQVSKRLERLLEGENAFLPVASKKSEKKESKSVTPPEFENGEESADELFPSYEN